MSDTVIVYYDPETVQIVSVSPAPDAALEARYASFEIPAAELDLAATQVAAAPPNGYLYYRRWGDIAGVALRRDPELAKLYACLEVDAARALPFMEGAQSVEDFYVGPSERRPGEMALLARKDHKRIARLAVLDADFVELPEASQSDPLRLVVLLAPAQGCVLIRLDDDARLDAIECAAPTLTFMLTRRGDPSQILAQIEVSVAELIAKREILAAVAADLRDVSVYTRRILEATSCRRLTDADADLLRLPLPARHFLDLVQCRPAPAEAEPAPGLRLVVARAARRMTLHAPRRARAYDRGLAAVPVLFVPPGDPSFVLFGAQVSFDELRAQESVEIAAPDWLYAAEFDVVFPFLFEANAVVEM